MRLKSNKYEMKISRLTIDKLGIQMYDRVSAVLAELIANAYDADAQQVRIKLPFGRYLARKVQGTIEDQGFEIVIEDDGSGMTADQVNEFYLNVGYNRRVGRGERTPKYQRKVMGRKGIGKLAPFGICHEVEVLTAGGPRTAQGYAVSNLVLDLGGMLDEKVDSNGNVLPYHPDLGQKDGSFAPSSGTKLILRLFDRRRVPTGEELDRQLAARFGLSRENWSVGLEDSLETSEPIEVGTLNIDLLEGTFTDVGDRPVKVDGHFFPVSGWLAYAKDSYKDEVMAGIRLYARGKIVAQTRDFDIKTGFTGEFKMRSYLTGMIHAEWIDDTEDLVRTDRQDIIWNSEFGNALREWGQNLLRELASKAEASAGRRTWDIFLEQSRLEERLQIALPNDKAVRDSILRAASMLVRRVDRDALMNPDYITRVVRHAFALGPHSTLLATLEEVASMTDGPIDLILDLFERARLVEMYSLGQVAQERVSAVEQLRRLISNPDTVESQLQALIEKSPWILYADWTPLSFNKSLATTRSNFESWYHVSRGQEIITSAIASPSKAPDFVMLNNKGILEVVEIKRPQHSLTNVEFGRAFGYLEAVRTYIKESPAVKELFPEAKLTIVCDSLSLGAMEQNTIRTDADITHRVWHDVLQSTSQSHEDFLRIVREMQGELPELSGDAE